MTIRFPHASLVLLFAACAFAWPRTAHAQVHQCITPEGQPLYTDQKCEALGAVPAPQKPAASSTGARAASVAGDRMYRGGCARTLQDLAFELRSAIDAGDANRLSGIYHWVGVSDASAVNVMDRLDAIAHRPLLDITPIEARPIEAASAAGSGITGEAGDVAHTTARRPPVGLRLEQSLPGTITPAHVVLGLHRHFGCWWVSL